MDRPPANDESAPPPPRPAPPPGRCHFWLPNKRRHCANSPLASTQYCRNHPPDSSSASRRRVPCPVDPSHMVFEENLEAHVGKCPFRKHADALAARSYYSKGVNSGVGEAGGAAVTSAAKRASVHKLSEEEFWGLVAKIRSVHATAAVQMHESHVAPDACDKWMRGQVDRTVPYQEKHVVQQVSIVGNMESFGLLPRGGAEDAAAENATSVVEFGAGTGYLTQMLADCYGIKNIFLVERRSYKLNVSLCPQTALCLATSSRSSGREDYVFDLALDCQAADLAKKFIAFIVESAYLQALFLCREWYCSNFQLQTDNANPC